jgi:hypothetical protein
MGTLIFIIVQIFLCIMGRRKIPIVGDVNKIGKQEEGEDQGATASSNTPEILEQSMLHPRPPSHNIKNSGHRPLLP